jgi:hypothetical protein
MISPLCWLELTMYDFENGFKWLRRWGFELMILHYQKFNYTHAGKLLSYPAAQ